MAVRIADMKSCCLETDGERIEVRTLEAEIDGYLHTRYMGAPVRVPLEYVSGRHVLMELVRRYRVAGWMVKIQSFEPAALLFA